MGGATDDDVDRAFADGSILRIHLLRPTWHFVLPGDLRWLVALTAPRVHAVNASMYRKLELDGATIARSHATLIKVLRGGHQLTRDELRPVLEQAGIAAAQGLRLAYIMMSAELEGLVCSGARSGKQFTYALVDERVPHTRTLSREASLAELAGRYFKSRGPATVQDFAKWSGLMVTDARAGLEAVSAQLQPEVVEGRTYWSSATARPPGEASPTAHLLSIYDEYISAYRDRGAHGGPEVGARLIALGNALNYVIVVQGRIVGTWRRTLGKKAVTIETTLFSHLTPAERRAVADAARRYGDFLGLPVALS